jgi:hypothetical protein
MSGRVSLPLIVAFAIALNVSPAAAQASEASLRAKELKLKQQKQPLRPLPGPAIERFLRMPPEERERALSQLPPERRQQIEQRLRRLERLSPEQREQLERRYDVFQSLPPGRRLLVRAAIQRLRNAPEAQRKAFLESDEAKRRFTVGELQLLRDVSGLPDIE